MKEASWQESIKDKIEKMKEIDIFEMSSPYRDKFRITGYQFGEGEHSVAIVGTMRGDEIQQQYICAMMVSRLTELEQKGMIAEGKSILVIPTCNPFSLNVNSRFWSMDGTDINRMFPGYDKGETTQRIAAAVFETIKDYKYGMQLASFYVPGDFIPHVRMLKTGYEAIEEAMSFGLPYVTIRKPLPFDTTLLNYNWQIWESKAFSIYSGYTETIDEVTSQQTIDAILRFLNNCGATTAHHHAPAFQSIVLDEDNLVTVRAHNAGILQRLVTVGQRVSEGQTLARIINPLDGTVLEHLSSPVSGIIFFSFHRPLIYQNALLFRIDKA